MTATRIEVLTSRTKMATIYSNIAVRTTIKKRLLKIRTTSKWTATRYTKMRPTITK